MEIACAGWRVIPVVTMEYLDGMDFMGQLDREISETTHRRLRRARLERGWSESDLARRLGITTAWYYDVERCEDGLFTDLCLSMFFQLCRILDMLPVELVTGNANFVGSALRLPDQVRGILEVGVTNDLREKLEETVYEDIVGEYYLTACDLQGYIEVGDVLGVDWGSSLMADYRYWQEIQSQDRCHWPSSENYPSGPFLE